MSARRFGVVSLLWLTFAVAVSPVSAQAPVVLVPDASRTGFLTRFTLLTSVEALDEGDPRYRWDADIGVGVDVVDYGRGRVNVSFNFENVLGDELQPFDPRQGNYTIETLGTFRVRPVEVGLLLHHVSRHLGDRTKNFGIAWNDLGLRLGFSGQHDRWSWQGHVLAVKTVALGFVDYAGDLGVDGVAHRRVSGRVSLIGSAGVHRRFVERGVLQRSAQTGARAEVGVSVRGEAGSMEVVLGLEKRVDADAFELAPRQWAFAGLRFVMP